MPADPNRKAVYQHCLDLMQRSFDLVDPATTRVAIPFEGTTLPAYFTNASTAGEPVATVLMWNGRLDKGAHVHLRVAGRDRGAWHFGAAGRLPGQWRGAAVR
jgi:hypothetical protein